MLYQAGACSDGDLAEMLRQYPYNFCVFIFPPWEEIYKADEERDQTFAEAVGVFNSLKFWYTKCGYHPVEVPCGSVRERADFIQRMASDVLCRV
jgi:predicted ATPase